MYSIEQYVVAVAKVCYILYYICLNDAVATITICETDEKYHNQNTTLLSSIEKVKVDLQSEQTNIEDLQSSLDDLIQSLKDAGDWCNTCNRPLV